MERFLWPMIFRLLLTGILFLPMIFCRAQHPDAIRLAEARFITGDDPAWKDPYFDDSGWKVVRTGVVWQAQGFHDYHGYAWYRMHVWKWGRKVDGQTWRSTRMCWESRRDRWFVRTRCWTAWPAGERPHRWGALRAGEKKGFFCKAPAGCGPADAEQQ